MKLKFTCNNKVLAECCFRGKTKTFDRRLGQGKVLLTDEVNAAFAVFFI